MYSVSVMIHIDDTAMQCCDHDHGCGVQKLFRLFDSGPRRGLDWRGWTWWRGAKSKDAKSMLCPVIIEQSMDVDMQYAIMRMW